MVVLAVLWVLWCGGAAFGGYVQTFGKFHQVLEVDTGECLETVETVSSSPPLELPYESPSPAPNLLIQAIRRPSDGDGPLQNAQPQRSRLWSLHVGC